MAHPPRSKPPLRSSSGPPNPCITPSTEMLVVVVNLMSWSPPHVHAWCAHEARITSRRSIPSVHRGQQPRSSRPDGHPFRHSLRRSSRPARPYGFRSAPESDHLRAHARRPRPRPWRRMLAGRRQRKRPPECRPRLRMALERITFRRCVLRRRGYSRDAMARGRRRSRQANRGTERGTRATVAKESAALSPDREPYVPTLDSLEEISGWWLGTFRE